MVNNGEGVLKGQCPGTDILLIVSSTYENWCSHIESQLGKLKYSEDTTKLMVPPHKQILLHNTPIENISNSL